MRATIFETEAGWCGFGWTPAGLRKFALPRDAEAAVMEEIGPASWVDAGEAPPPWDGLIAEAVGYFRGEGPVDFSKYPVDLSGVPPFHKKVYEAMRKIEWGSVVTYGELAAASGNRAAARAAGQACARNPVALVIPCHRVVGVSGLTGFGGGLDLKRRMLQIEGYREFSCGRGAGAGV
ncbi:MAG: methylated-DNA--[protein]-cysteine S-methyltransferase [Ignavibacteriales bacterium]